MATITDADMRNQVAAALMPYTSHYDVNAIVDEIQATHGTINIDYWPADVEEFWKVVERHAKTVCDRRWVAEIELCPRCGFDAAAHAHL